CKRFGYTRDEMKELSIDDISDDSMISLRSKEAEKYLQNIMKGETVTTEWLSKDKKGNTLWHEMKIRLIEIDGEKRVLAVARDIEKRKKAEKKLKRSEKKYRTYIDNAPDGIFITDGYGNYLEVNNAATELTGYSEDELLSMNISDITADECSEKALEGFQRLKKEGYISDEYIFIHKDGSKHWWTLEAVKLSDIRYLAFTNDITEKKKVEQKIKTSKKQTEEILNAAGEGIRIVNKDFEVIKMNDTMAEMAGVSKKEGAGMSCREMFGTKDICGTEKCSMIQVLKNKEVFQRQDIRKTPNGEEIPCLDKITPYLDENGEIIGIIESFRDITEIKKKEEKLREKLDELKRWKKVTVNRELKMRELKQKIRELEEKISGGKEK
ncbi:MAG: PAS domain S-box protein, partial [Candidatus Thermoplasmatota archaeon]